MSEIKPDWIVIEGLYRAGQMSLRKIAKEHGTASSTIKSRAKKHGWTQDAAGIKRQIVSERMAGVAQGSAQRAMIEIESAATQDVEDMELGLRGARKALVRSVDALEGATDPKDIKTLSECIKLNVDTIRTIRELDKAAPSAGDQIQVNVIFAQAIA